MNITEARRDLIKYYVQEFRDKYLLTPKGQWHRKFYENERRDVNRFWKEIKEKKADRKDITDDVLEKLLPYASTKSNRERGVHISAAPAITKDIKVWYENAGVQKHENWPKVANAIFDLFFEVVEKNNFNAFKKFENDADISRGFKSGMLTPTFL